jgi:hypothetical protein
MNNASKGRCVTVTPSDNSVVDTAAALRSQTGFNPEMKCRAKDAKCREGNQLKSKFLRQLRVLRATIIFPSR